MDLPVWQALYEELGEQGFLPVAVALDTGGAAAAREWIEKAHPTYPCLIDEQHVVARLYDMVNVPNAVWIDEQGQIVRATEPAGAGDGFRTMDRTTFKMAPEAIEDGRRRREVYTDALRDWVQHGAASRHLLDAVEARRRLAGPSEEHALAATHFRLGVWLYEHGEADAAQRHFHEAQRLRPESWAYKRQAWALEQPGLAGGPPFWAAVEALGERRYYPEIAMEGMPR